MKVVSAGTAITINAANALTGTGINPGIVSATCYDGASLLNSEVCLDCTTNGLVFTTDKSVTTTSAN